MSAPPPPPPGTPPPGWQPPQQPGWQPPPQPGWQVPPQSGWQQPPQPGWQAPPGPGYPGTPGPPSGVHPDGRPKGLPPAVSVTIVMIGLVVAVFAAFFVVRSFVETLTDGEDINVPGERTMHLDTGGWRLYEESDGFGSGNALSSVTITGPDGAVDLRREPFGTTETLEFDGREYTAIGRFDVEVAGDHRVMATGEPGTARLRVGRPITHLGSEWPWMLGGAVGGVMLLVGSILSIFSFRNRGRARRYAAGLGR